MLKSQSKTGFLIALTLKGIRNVKKAHTYGTNCMFYNINSSPVNLQLVDSLRITKHTHARVNAHAFVYSELIIYLCVQNTIIHIP